MVRRMVKRESELSLAIINKFHSISQLKPYAALYSRYISMNIAHIYTLVENFMFRFPSF